MELNLSKFLTRTRLITSGAVTMQRLLTGCGSRWRNIYYRLLGVKLHGYIWLRPIEISRQFDQIEIESGCALDTGVTLLCSDKPQAQPKIYIGADTYINRHTFIDASLSITIGRNCAIGPGCYFTDHDHGCDPDRPPLEQPFVAKPTRIGHSVWIGANVTILKGVTIGDYAVVGAGSVVTHDIPPGAVAVGVPAQIIRYRS